jgi:hypothetical protein
MSTLPLPSHVLARLRSRAEGGHDDAKALLHLIDHADKRDQDVAKFVDSYSKTIGALCRRLGALERRPSAQPATPVEDAPIVNEGPMHWAEARRTEALAAICPAMQRHGIRTSEFPPAVPAPAAPTPSPTALVELVGNELPLLPDGRVDEARIRAAIHTIAAWLDTQGNHGSANCLRRNIDR